MCVLTARYTEPDGTQLMCATSIQHPCVAVLDVVCSSFISDCPPRKRYVRARTKTSGFALRPVPCTSCVLLVTSITLCAHPKFTLMLLCSTTITHSHGVCGSDGFRWLDSDRGGEPSGRGTAAVCGGHSGLHAFCGPEDIGHGAPACSGL